MKFFFIDTMGDLHNELCFLSSPPDDLGLSYYKMARGEYMGSAYPVGARVLMSEEYPGFKLSSLVGNSNRYLIVERPVKEVIESFCGGVDVEYLPLAIYNHKKRLQRDDYFIINPIGVRDCLDLSASQIEYLNDPGDPYHGAVVGVDRFVLDPKKLDGAPALFRVREEPGRYVVRADLVDTLRMGMFTNLLFEDVEQSPGA
jgi:hypothetical protein